MNSIDQKHNTNPYSAKRMAKPVNFYCDAPQAKSVHIEGGFSDWAPLPMQRRVDGWWFLQVQLSHGHHQYRFTVDGQRLLDPRATGTMYNEANEQVSVISSQLNHQPLKSHEAIIAKVDSGRRRT